MKKVLMSLLAMAIATTSFAQINIGVRAGANLASLSNTGEPKYEQPVIGGYAGGVFEYDRLFADFGLRAELNFSMQGGCIRYDNESYITSRYNYLTLPVMLQYNVLDIIDLMAGVQFGYLLGGNYKNQLTALGQTVTTEGSIDVSELNAIDFGIVVGGTYMLDRNLGIDLRYTFGLSNIVPETKLTAAAEKNGVCQLGVIYKF